MPIADGDGEGVDQVGGVGVQDVGEDAPVPTETAGVEQELAVLALRLEMAGVYLRLAAG